MSLRIDGSDGRSRELVADGLSVPNSSPLTLTRGHQSRPRAESEIK